MKSPLMILGVLLIVLGALAIGYQSFTYPKEEKLAQIGDVKLTAETDKRVDIPPYLGGLAIAAGLVLVVVGRKR
jgi:hypothetical protein